MIFLIYCQRIDCECDMNWTLYRENGEVDSIRRDSISGFWSLGCHQHFECNADGRYLVTLWLSIDHTSGLREVQEMLRVHESECG